MQTITSESKGMVVVTRPPSPSIAACELTYMSRTKIDFEKLAEQHAAYMNVLRYLGLTVVSLPAQPALADAVFVEDTAVVLDEIALISSPCRSRKPELASDPRFQGNRDSFAMYGWGDATHLAFVSYQRVPPEQLPAAAHAAEGGE